MQNNNTQTYQELATLMGVEAADKLVAEYRGQELYIPEPDKVADHHLAKVLGLETAKRLSHYWQGDILTLPMQQKKRIAERNNEIIEKHSVGMTKSELAREYNLHVRTVRKIIEKHNQQSANEAYARAQLNLFNA